MEISFLAALQIYIIHIDVWKTNVDILKDNGNILLG